MTTIEKSQLPMPTKPCHNCGGTKWWWRESKWSTGGDWLCAKCKPAPNRNEVKK